METLIKGITVKLYDKVQTGEDGFGHPIYKEVAVEVENVLVGEPTTDDITTTQDITGKVVVYTLAIPKGDQNDWKDKRVEFFGDTFITIGFPVQGIEANIPLCWNKKIKVARYG